MSSNIEHVQSAILSQETREPGSQEAIHGSRSEFKLPGIKKAHSSSSTYLKPYDRLHYDSKKIHRYGKINALLSDVSSSIAVPLRINEIKEKGEGPKPIPHPRKIPVKELIGTVI